jgi:hypothetical protein
MGLYAAAAAAANTKKRDFFPLLLPHGSSIVQPASQLDSLSLSFSLQLDI